MKRPLTDKEIEQYADEIEALSSALVVIFIASMASGLIMTPKENN